MYQVGDLIIYGNTGVCKIAEIVDRENFFTKKSDPHYALIPLFESCQIFTPVVESKIFMRPVVSKEEAAALIHSIPTLQITTFFSPTLREVEEHYKSVLNTYDCKEILLLIMSIYLKKQDLIAQNKKLGQIDERYMKKAEKLLFGEISAVLDIPFELVPKHIEDILAIDRL